MIKHNSKGQFAKHEVVGGQTNNQWTFIEYSHKNKGGNIFWLCRCSCGNEKPVSVHRVLSGQSKSCGCLRKNADFNIKHGLRKHPLYKVWRGIKYRCLVPTCPDYDLYGGRGITICDRWINSIKNFFADMNTGYSFGMHIDRINVNGNYEPLNCRWVTPKQNNNNKRNNVYVTYDGRTHTPAQWAEELGIKANTIANRKRKGYPDYEAIFGLK